MKADVAIVGAGLAGIVCAQRLVEAGRRVVLFDKGRKCGGRLSTRRTESTRFDHGAPLFTARSSAFQTEVEAWAERGIVERWEGDFKAVRSNAMRGAWLSSAWVGVPSMSAIPAALAEGLDVRTQVRVGSVTAHEDAWTLADEHGAELGTFGAVLINTPAGQAAPLLEGVPALRDAAAAVEMDPCWTVMVVPEQPWDPGFDAAEFDEGPLSRAVAQASKPGRDATGGWVIHAESNWTREHWESPAEQVIETLVAALAKAADHPIGSLRYASSHRWRYARVSNGLPAGCLWDAPMRLGACGDWCGGPGLEGAWISGLTLAARVE